jgi:hypothetical protein
MKVFGILLRSSRALGLLTGLLLPLAAAAAEPEAAMPDVLRAGFTLYPKGGADLALDAWRKGGLADDNRNKLAAQINYFKQTERTVGNYRSYELIDGKRVSTSSKVLYLAVNFERGAIYGRFVLYRTDRDWVVQSMDFNTRPEAIMPWLSFAGATDAE